MESRWKIIIAVVIVAIIAILIIYTQTGTKVAPPQQPAVQKLPAPTPETVLPAATGNIDDAVNALLDDSSVETTASTEKNGDANLLDADAQIIGDFGQSYDASEF